MIDWQKIANELGMPVQTAAALASRVPGWRTMTDDELIRSIRRLEKPRVEKGRR